MDLEEIERLHDSGLLPDWAYYMQNGKSPMENLQEQHKKIMDRLRRKSEIDAELEKQIEEEVAPQIEKVIDDLFKDWQ